MIYFLSKGLKKGKYTWAIKVDYHPDISIINIRTGVMTKALKEDSGKGNSEKCKEGSEVLSIDDVPKYYNMTSPANNLKESDFITGSILYYILDLTNGNFKIQNT